MQTEGFREWDGRTAERWRRREEKESEPEDPIPLSKEKITANLDVQILVGFIYDSKIRQHPGPK
jgi:hypothetical protein